MTEEDFQIHGGTLLMLYQELEADLQGYVHDPAAHNLCSAVVEGYSSTAATARDCRQVYFAYSSPKGLPGWLLSKYEKSYLIPSDRPMGALFHGSGMGLLHTEVRLINYLWAHRTTPGILPSAGEINFFSTRTVCGGCQRKIGEAQGRFSGINLAFRPFELSAESFGGDAGQTTNVYMGVARRSTLGQTRQSTTDFGGFR